MQLLLERPEIDVNAKSILNQLFFHIILNKIKFFFNCVLNQISFIKFLKSIF